MLCATAAEYEGTVIDDIVPGHTARAPTSAWPRWATRTTRASTTWSRSRPRTGTCCPTSRGAATASTSTPTPRRRSSARATSSAACSG
jgi:hypothetical protein